ncbi:MAG: hypothetical protein ACPG5T_03000, partial [Endozoicomonas sp.]
MHIDSMHIDSMNIDSIDKEQSMTATTVNHGNMSTPAWIGSAGLSGAVSGALAPLHVQMSLGEVVGRAFGRAVGLPVGVVCKGVVGLANTFRSAGNQLPSKSINQYSIKIANVGKNLGCIAGLCVTVVTWPVLLKIAPYTAAAGAVIGGLVGGFCASFPYEAPSKPAPADRKRDFEVRDNNNPAYMWNNQEALSVKRLFEDHQYRTSNMGTPPPPPAIHPATPTPPARPRPSAPAARTPASPTAA